LVTVGKTADWVTFCVGAWNIHFRIEWNGVYPDVERIISTADKVNGTYRFADADTAFLLNTLSQPPLAERGDEFLTLDLNGQVIVRAKTAEEAKPTDVVLSNSAWSGKHARLSINGEQLQRAMRLGLRELQYLGDEQPITWHDATRTYATAAVRSSGIEPSKDATRIESPKVTEATATSSLPPLLPQSKPERKTKTVIEPTSSTNNKPASNTSTKTETGGTRPLRRKQGQQDLAKLIDRAIKFRTALHDLLHESSDLVKALKQQRRQSKAIQNALTSISQVKSLL
jgi:hypothetical protein